MQEYRDEQIVKWGIIIVLLLSLFGGLGFFIWYWNTGNTTAKVLAYFAWFTFIMLGVHCLLYYISERRENKFREKCLNERIEKIKKEKEEKAKENEDKGNKTA